MSELLAVLAIKVEAVSKNGPTGGRSKRDDVGAEPDQQGQSQNERCDEKPSHPPCRFLAPAPADVGYPRDKRDSEHSDRMPARQIAQDAPDGQRLDHACLR